MADRKPLVAANWKMNGTLAVIEPLLAGIRAGLMADCAAEVAICPPYVYLPYVSGELSGAAIDIGAQNVSQHGPGAFTGEISVSMLEDFNCRYCIVGHSERRNLYGEGDRTVAEKFAALLDSNIRPILCLGERLEEREANITDEVIARQLDTVIDKVGIQGFNNAVIAYEPVWAIGTGKTATPEQAQEVHAFIRLRLARHDEAIAEGIQILYGGSVKADNANDLFSMTDVDGGLIGGASLNVDEFVTICHATR